MRQNTLFYFIFSVIFQIVFGDLTVKLTSEEVIPSSKIPYTVIAIFSSDIKEFDSSKVISSNVNNIVSIFNLSNTYYIHIYPKDDSKLVVFQLDVGAGISKSGEKSNKSEEITIAFSEFIEDIYFYSNSSSFEYWYNGLALPDEDDKTRYLLFQIEESDKIADKDVEFEIGLSPNKYSDDPSYFIHQSNNLTTIYKIENDMNVENTTAYNAFDVKYKFANNFMIYNTYYSNKIQITFENVNTSESITLTDTEPTMYKYISFRSLSNNILHIKNIDFTRKNQKFTIKLNYNENDIIYSPLPVYYTFSRPVIHPLYSIYFQTCDSVYVEKEVEVTSKTGIIYIVPLYKTSEKCIISMIGSVYSIDGDILTDKDLDSIIYPLEFIDNYRMNFPLFQYKMKYLEWNNKNNKNNNSFEILFDLECIDDTVIGFTSDNILYPYEITFGAVNNHYINVTYTYRINYTVNEIISSKPYQICEAKSKFVSVWCRIEIFNDYFEISYGKGIVFNKDIILHIEMKNKTELVIPHYFSFKSTYSKSYVKNIKILDNDPDISSTANINSLIVILLLLILF